MSERLFIIMEVKETSVANGGIYKYVPVEAKTDYEKIWLHPSRIMKESELFYSEMHQYGDYMFSGNLKWIKGKCNTSDDGYSRLIHRPQSPPKSEMEKWLDDAPSGVCDEMKDWIRKMPKGEKE